jgi:hypothetical protein
MGLCEKLGMTLGQLLDEMTSAELSLWVAKARIEAEDWAEARREKTEAEFDEQAQLRIEQMRNENAARRGAR